VSFRLTAAKIDPQRVEATLLEQVEKLTGEDRRQAEIGARLAQQAVDSDALGHKGEGYLVDVVVSASATLGPDPKWDPAPAIAYAERMAKVDEEHAAIAEGRKMRKVRVRKPQAPMIHKAARLRIEIGFASRA